jgi:hypothetical protein
VDQQDQYGGPDHACALLLGLLGFELQIDIKMVQALIWFVAASTVASGIAYLFIWGARFFSIEGRK